MAIKRCANQQQTLGVAMYYQCLPIPQSVFQASSRMPPKDPMSALLQWSMLSRDFNTRSNADDTAKTKWQVSCSLWMLHATHVAPVIHKRVCKSASAFAAHLFCRHQLVPSLQI